MQRKTHYVYLSVAAANSTRYLRSTIPTSTTYLSPRLQSPSSKQSPDLKLLSLETKTRQYAYFQAYFYTENSS
jgi:hypothetical protein